MSSKRCYVIVGILFVLPTWVLANGTKSLGDNICQGGRSIRGLSQLIDHSPGRTISCCDENVCHGGLALKEDAFSSSFISADGDNGASTVKRYAQALEISRKSNEARHKRSVDSPSCLENKMACLPMELRCCSANMSVFFPISALSALTGERVHVLQAPPLVLQPVVFGRCETDHSTVLDADCQQDLMPEIMHVARTNADTNELELSREPVMVESGCSCRMNPEPLKIIDGPDIDEALTSFLDLWTID